MITATAHSRAEIDGRAALDPDAWPLSPEGDPVARAVIGDALRRPGLWCDFRPCISRFTDPAALGESDVRKRALAAGWQEDLLGRLACPDCAQHATAFVVVYPLACYDAATGNAADPEPPTAPVPAAAIPAAADAPAPESPSRWDDIDLPRLNLAAWTEAEAEPAGRGWFRRHEVGRHR